MSFPLNVFRWMPPDLIAEELIPPLDPAAPRASHRALLSALAEPDRWCPPGDEPQLVAALLAALRQMPGFPRDLALHVTSRPTDALPAHIRAGSGFVLTGGIAHPSHTFSGWRLDHGCLSPFTPDQPLPNGLFETLAQMLAPSLSALLASEATCGPASVRLRAATVSQLATMPQSCDRLFGIELPRLDGLLPIDGHWPAQGSRRVDDLLLRRIQEAAPVLQALFRNRRTTERALGLPSRSLEAHLDGEFQPLERGRRSRHLAHVPIAPRRLPPIQDSCAGKGQ